VLLSGGHPPCARAAASCHSICLILRLICQGISDNYNCLRNYCTVQVQSSQYKVVVLPTITYNTHIYRYTGTDMHTSRQTNKHTQTDTWKTHTKTCIHANTPLHDGIHTHTNTPRTQMDPYTLGLLQFDKWQIAHYCMQDFDTILLYCNTDVVIIKPVTGRASTCSASLKTTRRLIALGFHTENSAFTFQ